MKSLLILGAGGHGKVVKEIARDFLGYEVVDFLDDNAKNAIGRIKDLEKFRKSYTKAFVALGNNDLRKELFIMLEKKGFEIVNIIHPSAIISSSVKLGKGIYIGAGAILNAKTIICDGVIIGIGAKIDHDSKVCEFSYIKTGSIVMAGSKVCEKEIIKEGSVYK
jgi:UDP-N-acetylbacillosamine N-acetyltransferase